MPGTAVPDGRTTMDKPEAHLFASLNDRQQRRLIEAFVSVENKLGKQTRFDLATGWSELGRQHGVAVLFPEQKCGNNPQNCSIGLSRSTFAATMEKLRRSAS